MSGLAWALVHALVGLVARLGTWALRARWALTRALTRLTREVALCRR